MSELEFDFQEAITEIDALARVAADFIEPQSIMVLPRLRLVLESIRATPSEAVFDWGIPEALPLVTKVSRGCYQPDDQGEKNVFAEITSVWSIRRLRPKGKKSLPASVFSLVGKASTRVRLFNEAPGGGKGPQLAMWRSEIADVNSPGCHFHVQILGDQATGQFPKSLDVPRLPGVLTTPAGVVEYVLGELFQDGWAQHVGNESADLKRWAPIQRQRLAALFAWHSAVIKMSSGSPWPTLKRAKPEPNLFLERNGT